MIHMLSRFDLKSGHTLETFKKDYLEFCDRMIEKGLVVSTSTVGQRILDTPMDTDKEEAPEYYAVMTFRDRNQLDQAYAYIASSESGSMDLDAHQRVNDVILNPVFTCWDDLEI